MSRARTTAAAVDTRALGRVQRRLEVLRDRDDGILQTKDLDLAIGALQFAGIVARSVRGSRVRRAA